MNSSLNMPLETLVPWSHLASGLFVFRISVQKNCVGWAFFWSWATEREVLMSVSHAWVGCSQKQSQWRQNLSNWKSHLLLMNWYSYILENFRGDPWLRSMGMLKVRYFSSKFSTKPYAAWQQFQICITFLQLPLLSLESNVICDRSWHNYESHSCSVFYLRHGFELWNFAK